MPYKSERLRIAGMAHDKRRKLSEQDKAEIKELVGMSIREIARMYGVDKRMIQFIKFPERLERCKQCRAMRGGSMQYYSKEKQREYIKKHRHHKQEIWVALKK